MRLEHLEINGFKSFSDRSELAFDRGVTAIVGPNGCGKSNVADAITWVMGEQSAKSLRGDRMEDVIFNGSDARKPTSAAEVRLRFTGVVKSLSGPAFAEDVIRVNGNGNGHGPEPAGASNGNGHHALDGTSADELIRSVAREVEVTRRLYRSGESEYLIDGQVCRLRDVHELLMDTGLGAKAYAIIEQGKIGLILSSRPTDRRQLIEEAAGVTKYKARRRAAALKLEAAQQNLTRVDDIVFEIEKQRGTLKRQAAKARRYQKLRDELRRWEKTLFARKYRQLAETIESARTRLADARGREGAAAARVAELEADLGRARIEQVEAESAATARRETAHACEIAINRRQQQVAFEREQVAALDVRRSAVAAELALLESRREPARVVLVARRETAETSSAERDRAAAAFAAASEACDGAYRGIEGLEADVEAARSEVFSAINAATALRHSLEHAAAAHDRVGETLSKLQVEAGDVRIEADRAEAGRAATAALLHRAQTDMEATRMARAARESELASARIEHEWRARSVRSREYELAGLAARLASLEELDARRTDYGDAARKVLAQANGRVCQRGAVADYLEVEAGYERAVDAFLGDLLQHVIVESPEHAAAGLDLVREERAGRCGFLVVDRAEGAGSAPDPSAGAGADRLAGPEGAVALSTVVRVTGPYGAGIRRAIGDAWIVNSYDRAADVSRLAALPVATTRGDVFLGPWRVAGGNPDEARGILETKRQILDMRARVASEREALARLEEETARFEAAIVQASDAISALDAEHHRQEKGIVALEGELQHSAAERARLEQKGGQLARERRLAEEERDGLDRRQAEARTSIAQLEGEQRAADECLTAAQRRLFEARDVALDLGRQTADAGALHAALVERTAALATEIERLEEAFADLGARAGALAGEHEEAVSHTGALAASIVASEAQLDEQVRTLDSLREAVHHADAEVGALRARTDGLEVEIRAARTLLETVRAAVSELDIQRATAETDWSHLAQSCVDAVQATLDDVLVEVEQAGDSAPDAAVIYEEQGEEEEDVTSPQPHGDDPFPADSQSPGASQALDGSGLDAAVRRTLTAEDAIAALRGKIDRLGPVNMMAIEQYDELEARHGFLTTQRQDLVDSISQTGEAIRRIDETTRTRFAQAFAAINANFQQTFSTLFGGGRAGLTLLDETDPLESGIEIIAQPPGKRLQSVQLLSGGEKALTAIALMFALFRHKPSPFCLLDEIDAPLDDANIGRFVEMLRSMQEHTQFILITHNRKTMEIADRLYGVTMEEPGVSKLISVRLN